MLATAWNACVNSRNQISGWIMENVRFVGRRNSLRIQRLKMAAISMGKSNFIFILSASGTESGLRRDLLQIGAQLLAGELDEHVVERRFGQDEVLDLDVHGVERTDDQRHEVAAVGAVDDDAFGAVDAALRAVLHLLDALELPDRSPTPC